ncbi:uncharacterized protein BCR38DRAFT_334117 [Pseudomassariella vexata]|uniref:Uncharacterized protein n=1 Tax=Pseudomassariella vexata TaxID=1141098 RepID=A0A1Y2EE30_9PEZI|nr:uncharacterized protein BCR38DRAFT_334117 [Pseudomassariella vexata]ORY69829.1 hypothetical protein BCR38DRAFT_334117 [Pseudomassariella vexata]
MRLRDRSFATSRPLLVQPKSTTSSASRRSAIQSPHPDPSSYGQRLAQAMNGTILYESVSSKMFLFSSYLAAYSTMTAAGLNIYFNVYHPPAGVGEWVPYAFGAVGMILGGFAMSFALRPANIVRSIKVLPNAATTVPGAKPVAPTLSSKILIEVQARGSLPIPGLPLKKMIVEPHNIILHCRMYNPKVEPTMKQKFLNRKEEEKRLMERREYDKNHLMTVPFRDGKRAASTIFTSIRRGLTGEGFAPIIILGTKYKLDISNAYALEDGRALDRLARLEEDPKVALWRSMRES